VKPSHRAEGRVAMSAVALALCDAGHRARLGSLSCRCCCLHRRARTVLVGRFLHLFVCRSATAVLARRRGLDASALTFPRAPVRILCTRASRAPAHTRTPLGWGKVVPLATSIDPRRRSVPRTGAPPLRVTFPLLNAQAPG
jgi:hypothetical protein